MIASLKKNKQAYLSKSLVAFPYLEFVPSYLSNIDFSHSISNGAWNDCALFSFIFFFEAIKKKKKKTV